MFVFTCKEQISILSRFKVHFVYVISNTFCRGIAKREIIKIDVLALLPTIMVNVEICTYNISLVEALYVLNNVSA